MDRDATTLSGIPGHPVLRSRSRPASGGRRWARRARLDPLVALMALMALGAGTVGAPDAAGQSSGEPTPNIQLTFQLIEANGFRDSDPEVSEIVDELRKLFRFDGYRLMASGVVSSIPSSAFTTSLAADSNGVFWIHGEVGPLERGAVRVRVNLNDEQTDATVLDASVNLVDGQTLVLGSARPTTDRAAIILVVTGRVVP